MNENAYLILAIKNRISFLIIFFVCFVDVSFSQSADIDVILPFGHTSEINSMKFSDDSRFLLTASNDNTIKLWDVKTGFVVRTFLRKGDNRKDVSLLRNINVESDQSMQELVDNPNDILVNAFRQLYQLLYFSSPKSVVADISPGSEKIAAGYYDGKVIIFRIADTSILLSFKAHSDRINQVSFVPGYKDRIITASDDGTLCLWNTSDGKLIRRYQGHNAKVRAFDFSKNGKQIVSAGGESSLSQNANVINSRIELNINSKIIFWEISSGKKVYELNNLQAFPTSVCYTDGYFGIIVGSADGSVRFYEKKNEQWAISKRHNYSPITAICRIPDSQEFLSVSLDNIYIHADYKKKFPIDKYTDIEGEIFSACIDNSGKYFATGDLDGNISIVNTKKGIKIRDYTTSTTGPIKKIQFIGDETQFLSLAKGQLYNWDLKSCQRTALSLNVNNLNDFVVFSPTSQLLSSSKSDIYIFNYSEGKARQTNHFKTNMPFAILLSKQNKILMASADSILHKGNRLSTYGTETEWASPDPKLYLIDVESGKKAASFKGHEKLPLLMVTEGQYNYFLTGGADQTIKMWSLNPYKKYEQKTYLGHMSNVTALAISLDASRFISADAGGKIMLWDTTQQYYPMAQINAHYGAVNDLYYSKTGDWVLSAADDLSLKKWSLPDLHLIQNMQFHSETVNSINVSDNEKRILSGSSDHTIALSNAESGELICRFIGVDSLNWIIVCPDGYYFATKGALGKMGFRKGLEVFSFDQFDLKFNRPDIVLKRMEVADSMSIEFYRKAYEKRLKKAGVEEKDLSENLEVPECRIINSDDIPPASESGSIGLDLLFSDEHYTLLSYNILINGIPLYGSNACLFPKKKKSFQLTENIQLNPGMNQVQVYCMNEKGAESFKESFNINNLQEETKGDLYIFAISVSDYHETSMNLQYAVKDGRDFVKTYANLSDHWEHVIIDSLFNKEANRDHILKLKQNLLKTNINDQVILYVSGHGLLDDNFDFYFATHDIDFNNPSERGVSYEELEWLLDSIPARKKLFLMDACHSGEVDKENLIASNAEKEAGMKHGVKKYSYRASILQTDPKPKQKMGINNSFELMQDLFTNLNRGSGAVVISAAAGDSYAMESDEWQNGVFTFTVLKGLKTKNADANKDGEVSVSELRDYVSKTVQDLTNGLQKPTMRQENVEFDWRVW